MIINFFVTNHTSCSETSKSNLENIQSPEISWFVARLSLAAVRIMPGNLYAGPL